VKKKRIAGIVAIISIALTFSMLSVSQEFPIFSSTETPEIETPEFLWIYRLIDMIAQAFVMFAAAACCVTVLRVEKKE
jgi:hypothetical protein